MLLDAGVGFTIVDAKKGRILFASREACRIIGYSRKEIAQKRLTFLEITHPDDREINVDQHRLLLAGKISQYTVVKRYIRQDGSLFNAVLTSRLLSEIDDDPCLALGIIQDIDAKFTSIDLNAGRRRVVLCEDFIRQHLTQPISIKDLTRAAGASERTLHRDFKNAGLISPLSFVKKLRLEKARESLLGATRTDTVTAIALRYCFGSHGRFAKAYHEAFGEYPSDTLQRSRNA